MDDFESPPIRRPKKKISKDAYRKPYEPKVVTRKDTSRRAVHRELNELYKFSDDDLSIDYNE